jgi:hypothetical protein
MRVCMACGTDGKRGNGEGSEGLVLVGWGVASYSQYEWRASCLISCSSTDFFELKENQTTSLVATQIHFVRPVNVCKTFHSYSRAALTATPASS